VNSHRLHQHGLILILLVAMASLGACATTGNKTDPEKQEKLAFKISNLREELKK